MQWKRPALVISFAPTAGFSFCFLGALLQAGVLGGEVSGLDFFERVKTSVVKGHNCTCNLILWVCILWRNLEIMSGYVPLRM